MAGSCAILAGVLGCTLPTLAAGASEAVHVTSPTGGSSCGAIQNHAAATTTNDGSAQASGTTVVECPVGIDIVKTGPGLAHVGDTVEYVMTVTATTITPLGSVTVTDPRCDVAPVFVLGDDGDLLLQPGETWSYSCPHKILASDPDPLPNTATALGIGNGTTVTDTDDHVVDIIHPTITIDKTVNPLAGNPGDPVVYTYVVKNTGDTTLYEIVVDDDKLGRIGTIAFLFAGKSATLTKGTTLGTTGVTNIGTATGVDILRKRVTDDDKATVTVVAGVKLVATGTGPVGWRLGVLLLAAGTFLLAAGTRRRRRAGSGRLPG